MNRRSWSGVAISCALAAIVARSTVASAPDACERLRSLTLEGGTIAQSATVEAGGLAQAGAGMSNLPAFCRVMATLKPTPDSDIKIEVWMPQAGWNGKFQAVGNGAWSGSIPSGAMANALRRGYATASTDTGHTGNTARFALGHPEKLTDFAWRSVHEMTLAAKGIVTAFYGRAARLSFWNGCSAGGRQAMKEAQMFPADYDGIIAGSPGLDWSGRSTQAVHVAHALRNEDAQLPPQALQLLHDAVVRACDANDGLKDGLIGDPSRCAFDPATLQCKAAGDTGCLTPAQVASARTVYATAVNPKSSRRMPGLAPGSERGWTPLGWTASARATGQDHFRFIIFKDPDWDVSRFNPETDTFRVDEGESAALNAIDANLEPFFLRGGKLLHYHGWSDPQISPFASVAYYQQVVDRFGAGAVRASYRLFMAPGMGHCGGGEGPNDFDALAALERWVEQGKAPDSIQAAHATNGRVDRTSPLCPYPQVAKYRGSGSVNEAQSFICAAR